VEHGVTFVSKKYFIIGDGASKPTHWSNPNHPLWGLARICVICLALLTLQLITATNYDIALDGEAGTLGGVALTATLLEWLRKT
jgi:hypothetical protein